MNPPDLSLTCYGGVAALPVALPELNLRHGASAWFEAEWDAIAQSLGFAQQFLRSKGPSPAQRAAAAYTAMLRADRPGESDEHGRAQAAILKSLTPAGGNRWRVIADPSTVVGGACYIEGATARTGPRWPQTSTRAFYPDTAPGYFGEGWNGPAPRASSACGWTTPLVLHLGTFPYVYSSRLDGRGPGARWSSSTALPAVLGLQVATSLLDPATNLQEDARTVGAILDHFIVSTAALIGTVPTLPPRPRLGALYQQSGVLVAHQGSLEVHGFTGPRGRLSAAAYNYVMRRFAAFFTVRRAALRSLATLSPDTQRQALASGDPFLRSQAEQIMAGA